MPRSPVAQSAASLCCTFQTQIWVRGHATEAVNAAVAVTVIRYVEVSDEVLVDLQDHASGADGDSGGGAGALDGAESFLNQLTPEQLQQFGPNQLLQLRKQIQEQQVHGALMHIHLPCGTAGVRVCAAVRMQRAEVMC